MNVICFTAKKQKLNGDLLTDEEKGSPMGLGYVSAAERLNLIYLASPEVMLKLLVQFGNEAWEFSMTGGLPKAAFWKAMNEKAETLAIILQGKNPAYMCIPWFTDPNQMTASLRQQLEHERPDAPPGRREGRCAPGPRMRPGRARSWRSGTRRL